LPDTLDEVYWNTIASIPLKLLLRFAARVPCHEFGISCGPPGRASPLQLNDPDSDLLLVQYNVKPIVGLALQNFDAHLPTEGTEICGQDDLNNALAGELTVLTCLIVPGTLGRVFR
jgi:hypothetical protein